VAGPAPTAGAAERSAPVVLASAGLLLLQERLPAGAHDVFFSQSRRLGLDAFVLPRGVDAAEGSADGCADFAAPAGDEPAVADGGTAAWADPRGLTLQWTLRDEVLPTATAERPPSAGAAAGDQATAAAAATTTTTTTTTTATIATEGATSAKEQSEGRRDQQVLVVSTSRTLRAPRAGLLCRFRFSVGYTYPSAGHLVPRSAGEEAGRLLAAAAMPAPAAAAAATGAPPIATDAHDSAPQSGAGFVLSLPFAPAASPARFTLSVQLPEGATNAELLRSAGAAGGAADAASSGGSGGSGAAAVVAAAEAHGGYQLVSSVTSLRSSDLGRPFVASVFGAGRTQLTMTFERRSGGSVSSSSSALVSQQSAPTLLVITYDYAPLITAGVLVIGLGGLACVGLCIMFGMRVEFQRPALLPSALFAASGSKRLCRRAAWCRGDPADSASDTGGEGRNVPAKAAS
jgi:hypothetical protein